jgi:hypothetical protein
MKEKNVFIAYDFEIRQGLTSDFEYAQRKQPSGVQIKWANRPEGRSQGEIWRDLVRKDLESALQFIAYVDLPNANVGFEIGYALGHGQRKQAALVRVSPTLHHWLELPPLNSFNIPQMKTAKDLLNQINSDNWIVSPDRPAAGNDLMLLCPHGAGLNFIDLVRDRHPDWHMLPEEGWNLKDLPTLLDGVGAVVWIVVPHREGRDARDGSENAAASVVAGFAEAAAIRLTVLKHVEARELVDVGVKTLDFGSESEFLELLKGVDDAFANVLEKKASIVSPGVERPLVGPLPQIEVNEPRFIGREGLLASFGDALRGLANRRSRAPVEGDARVQAIWYHGFGGMGKSWFLRRAILETNQRVPSSKVAFIDWDDMFWRFPLLQPPQVWKDVLEPIAYRVAQLYGVEMLDSYWLAVTRTQKAEAEASRVRERFHKAVRDLSEEKETDTLLRMALKERDLWAEGKQRRLRLEALQENSSLWNEILLLWFDKGGASATDPEAVLRPHAVRIAALQKCLRHVCSMAPLVLVLDTCEVLSLNLERLLRSVIAPLCDGELPFLVLFGSRSIPDAGEPPGSRDVWRANIGDERWRSVPFDEGVQFTVREIGLALGRMKRPVTQPELIAERIHRLTEGVPRPTRWLLDAHEQGYDISVELNILAEQGSDLGQSSIEEKIIRLMAERFLYHLSDRPERREDLKDIILLSLLSAANHELLSRVWQNARERLRELSIRYSLLAMGDLHATVRSFLRRRWRYEDRPREVDEVIASLLNVSEGLELPGSVGEARYMEVAAIKLNIHGWREGPLAIDRFAPAIAIALAFNEHVQVLVQLAAEILPTKATGTLGRALNHLLDARHTQRSPMHEVTGAFCTRWSERIHQGGSWSCPSRGIRQNRL